MNSATDVSVVIFASVSNVAQTLRMALRGTGVRTTAMATNLDQVIDGFSAADPNVLIVHVDSAKSDDPGLQMINFIRRGQGSPNRTVPIVVVSPNRDMGTIQATIDAGAHEYTLFPTSGDQLLRKVNMARNSDRVFIDTPDYVGPERKPPQQEAAKSA